MECIFVCGVFVFYMEYGVHIRGAFNTIFVDPHQFPNIFSIRAFRYASRSVKLKDDLVIPKGMKVLIPIVVLHHSKVFWENPEEFRPERCVILHPSTLLPLSIFSLNLFQFHF